ncbi:MAG TPA: type II toxin-antitoxin system VapC family toxin [Segetibacter sp.]|jgi:predicted nucleic acid-binding protein
MENKIIFLDTSVLIDFYRKQQKQNSYLFQLTDLYKVFAISVITEYEILIGSNNVQDSFWVSFFEKVTILPFTSSVNNEAVKIYRQLKTENKLIAIPDILIAATAISNNLALATLNTKHFKGLKD